MRHHVRHRCRTPAADSSIAALLPLACETLNGRLLLHNICVKSVRQARTAQTLTLLTFLAGRRCKYLFALYLRSFGAGALSVADNVGAALVEGCPKRALCRSSAGVLKSFIHHNIQTHHVKGIMSTPAYRRHRARRLCCSRVGRRDNCHCMTRWCLQIRVCRVAETQS